MYEELTAKIRPLCERKKMQFILIGKFNNISIKLVAQLVKKSLKT